MSSAYVGMTADILHHGHINLIEQARQYGNGDVTIGLLTDAVVAEYKRLPFLTYEQRKKIVENISGVTRVVPQEEWDFTPNLRRYRPDFLVHGDDWLEGPSAPYRQKAVQTLAEYGEADRNPLYAGGFLSGNTLSVAAIGDNAGCQASNPETAAGGKAHLSFYGSAQPDLFLDCGARKRGGRWEGPPV